MSNQEDYAVDSTAFNELKRKECVLRRFHSKFHNFITHEEVQALVKKSISTDVVLDGYHCLPYSDEKLGFLGSYFSLVTVTHSRNRNDKNTTKYFVKAIPLDVPSQLTGVQEKGYFTKEVEFFRLIEPLLRENLKGEHWAPKCYFAKEDVLIFEDLNTKGFSNRSKLLDEQSVKAAITSIARFNAASLLAEERNNGKSLKEIFPEALKESDFDPTDQRSYLIFTVAMDCVIAIAKNLGLDSSEIRKTGERVFDISKTSSTRRNVVSHGDLCSNNLMFNNDNYCMIIDFQLIRYAPLAQDVMHLLCLSTSREFRQQYEKKSIEYYYQVLVKTLRDNSFEGEIPTLDDILQSAEEQKLSALVMAMMFNPAQMMDGKAATVLNDSKNYEEYYCKDRRSFVFKHMAENKEYAKKLEDNVEELVEMSKKMDTLPTIS